MRILLVSEGIPALQLGGLGRHVVRLGNALLKLGHSVTLMGRADVDYAQCSSEVGFNGPFIGGFHLKRTGFKETMLGVFVPFKRPHIARRIARAILEVRGDFDVVHYHGHNSLVGHYIPEDVNFIQSRHDQGSECLTMVRFRNGQPCRETDPRACAGCATTRPNLLQREISAAAVRRYRRQTAAAFSRHETVFVSEFLRRRFDHVVPAASARPSVVIHNFIDLKSLPDRNGPVVRTGRPERVVIVSRIDEAKGVDAFLGALSRRRDAGLEVEIVGDGELRERTEGTFSSASVRFHGWCSEEETLQRVLHADALVVPSVCEEACPTTVLEGLALGKPVFAIARGGTPELKQYELWDGQLALFRSMDDLVDSLLGTPLKPGEPQREFKADAAFMVPRLIAAYQDVLGKNQAANGNRVTSRHAA